MKLVIGIGNTLREDDGAGIEAVAQLCRLPLGSDVQVMACHQLLPELVAAIHQAEFVIFIDARADAVPGEIRRETVEIPPECPAFSHHAAPEGLLAAARALYGAAPRGIVYSVGVERLGYGESLSVPVAEALPRLVAKVQEELHQVSFGYVRSSVTT